jgi:hypothetical protein
MYEISKINMPCHLSPVDATIRGFSTIEIVRYHRNTHTHAHTRAICVPVTTPSNDGGDGLQILRVAVNTLTKQMRTANKGVSSSLGVGQGTLQLLNV